MKNFIRISFFILLLTIFCAACTRSNSNLASVPSEQSQTTEQLTLPTPTNTPLPTPTSTPLPATRIENAEYSLFIGDYRNAQDEFSLAAESAPDNNILAAA